MNELGSIWKKKKAQKICFLVDFIPILNHSPIEWRDIRLFERLFKQIILQNKDDSKAYFDILWMFLCVIVVYNKNK